MAPLHDEIATYFFYIYHGDYWGQNMMVDANNHLLNSFVCRQIYRVFGDHLFLFRLPNVFAFVIFFYYAKKFAFKLKDPALNYLALVATLCIPFIFEYFGNCRGYGISLAFFMGGLYHSNRFLESERTIDFGATFLFLTIALLANISLLNVALLIFIYLIFILTRNRSWNWIYVVILGFFSLVLLFIIYYGFMLKNAGALYYGNMEGIWDTTGASIVKYTFFLEGSAAFLTTIALLMAVLFTGVRKYFNKSFFDYFKFPNFNHFFLFFGSLIMIELLAKIMHINYPEDRVGMYLIMLFLMLFFNALDELTLFRQAKWALLVFPVLFILKMNLITSVFSPDDRMTITFYKDVKKRIKDTDNLMVYNTMYWDWTYYESHSDDKESIANMIVKDLAIHDVVLTKTNLNHPKNLFKDYEIIAEEPSSFHIAYKRKRNLDRIRVFERDSIYMAGNSEYVNWFELDSLELFTTNKPIQVSLEGHLKTYENEHYISLVVQFFDAKNEQVGFEFYPFQYTYQRKLIDADFKHHFVFPKLDKSASLMKVYFWNKGMNNLELKDGKCYIYQINTSKDGTR